MLFFDFCNDDISSTWKSSASASPRMLHVADPRRVHNLYTFPTYFPSDLWLLATAHLDSLFALKPDSSWIGTCSECNLNNFKVNVVTSKILGVDDLTGFMLVFSGMCVLDLIKPPSEFLKRLIILENIQGVDKIETSYNNIA